MPALTTLTTPELYKMLGVYLSQFDLDRCSNLLEGSHLISQTNRFRSYFVLYVFTSVWYEWIGGGRLPLTSNGNRRKFSDSNLVLEYCDFVLVLTGANKC